MGHPKALMTVWQVSSCVDLMSGATGQLTLSEIQMSPDDAYQLVDGPAVHTEVAEKRWVFNEWMPVAWTVSGTGFIEAEAVEGYDRAVGELVATFTAVGSPTDQPR